MQKRISNVFLNSVLIFTICLVINRLPEFYKNSFSTDKILLNKQNQGEIILDSKKYINNNDYVITIGKERAFCDIAHNNDKIYSEKHLTGNTKNNLLITTKFKFKDSVPNKIIIDCNNNALGFKSSVRTVPAIFTNYSGQIYNLFIGIQDIALAPIIFLVLLMGSIYLKLYHNKNYYNLILFSSAGLIYALSLGYITRIFMQQEFASAFHIYSRICYSFAINYFLLAQTRKNLFIQTSLHVIFLAALITPVSSSVYVGYNQFYFLFILSGAFSLIEILKHETNNKFLLTSSVSLIFCLILDTYKQLTDTGQFLAPSYLWINALLLTISLISEEYNEFKLRNIFFNNNISEQFFKSYNQYLETIVSALENSFPRYNYSFRVDNYLTGSEASPQQSYQFITSKNKPINANQAFEIDINNYVSINYSANETFLEKFFSLQISQRNYSFLKQLLEKDLRIINSNLNKQNQSLTKLKSTLPNGVYERAIGALFIDIVDYTKSNETYGDDFTKFVSSSYFPAMVKYMSSYATPEVVRGDEVFFVVTPELSSVEGDIHKQSFQAIHSLQKFINEVGNKICAESGFPALVFRMGMTVGTGHIVVDDVQVRTSGDHINRAKRLQDSASKGEILIDGTTYDHYFKDHVIPISRKSIIVKKNIVDAVKIGFKKSA
jgi:class 3 adenylate cyclase